MCSRTKDAVEPHRYKKARGLLLFDIDSYFLDAAKDHCLNLCTKLSFGWVVKMGTPHLATSRRRGQEEKSQCKLASPYLTIYLVLLTAFAVPLRLKPRNQFAIEGGADRQHWPLRQSALYRRRPGGDRPCVISLLN